MDAPDESGTPTEHEAAPAAADCDGPLGCVDVEETAMREIQLENATSSEDEQNAEDESEADELADDEAASSVYVNAAMPAADTDPLDVSRQIMVTRYAQAVPSVQQEIAVGLHEQTSYFTREGKGTSIPELEESLAVLTGVTETEDGPAQRSEFQFCSSGWCQEQMQRKDARILELQCALDHMVQAMTIQQQDISSQRLFLAKQADHLTKFSISLHHEKLALQIDRAKHVRSRSNSRCSTPRASINTREVASELDSVSSPKASSMPQKSSLRVDTAMEANATVVGASEVFYSASTVAKGEQANSVEENLIDAVERCASLSANEYRPSTEMNYEHFTRSQSTRVFRPESSDGTPTLGAVSLEQTLSDVNLNDCSTCETASVYSHSSSSSLMVFTQNGDRDSSAESEKMVLMPGVRLGSKKSASVSFGQRLRSIRWKA